MKNLSKRQLNILFISILLFLGCFFIIKSLQAEESQSTISVYPAIIDVKTNPASQQKRTITIYNKNNKPVALRVYAENFTAADEFGGMAFNTESEREFSAKDWLTFDRNNILLDASKKTEIQVTIKTPKEAEPGGHYAVIFFETVKASDFLDKSNVGANQRMGALLFITVKGQILEKGWVLGASSSDNCYGVQCSFKTDKFREWGPVPFEFRFENTGNIHVKVKGKIEIYNTLGQKVAEVPVDQKTVLPKSTRFFEAKWLREPLFGRYTAKLIIDYGTLHVTDHAKTTFWVFPWKIFTILLVFASIVTVLVKIKRKNKHKMNKNGIQKEKSDFF